MASPWHLVKRFVGTVTAQPLDARERQIVAALLLAGEHALFARLRTPDQRHAMLVLARFDALMPGAAPQARRAALLHDIGKVSADLGTWQRVLATLVGGRTAEFRHYLDHERIGVELLTRAGSDPQTVGFVGGQGDIAIVGALRAADNV